MRRTSLKKMIKSKITKSKSKNYEPSSSKQLTNNKNFKKNTNLLFLNVIYWVHNSSKDQHKLICFMKKSKSTNRHSQKVKFNTIKSKFDIYFRIIDIETQKEDISTLMNEIKNYRNQNSAISDLKAEIHNLTR